MAVASVTERAHAEIPMHVGQKTGALTIRQNVNQVHERRRVEEMGRWRRRVPISARKRARETHLTALMSQLL